MTLRELTGQYQMLADMASDPSVDEQTLKDTMEGLEGEIEIKADSYATIIASMEGDIETLKKEEDRVKYRRQVLENRIKSMKLNLTDAMRATGKTKFKTDLYSFGIQKNAPSLVYTMPDSVPKESYVPEMFRIKQPDKIDTNAIKNAIKAGATYDWCKLEQSESLRIR